MKKYDIALGVIGGLISVMLFLLSVGVFRLGLELIRQDQALATFAGVPASFLGVWLCAISMALFWRTSVKQF